MPRMKSIVAIVGTTGAGKSRLAVDIARAFNGEVINADAMQVYRGCDIITNKITHDEMCGVPHHLLGCKVPGEEYVVGHWVSDTLQLIEDMHARDVLPVIVGGTTYWMQHLLFPNRLIGSPSKQRNEENIEYSPNVEQSLASLSGEQRQLFDTLPVGNLAAETIPSDDYSLRLHILLSSIDPDMASRWHWRDTRKVLRNLQIIKETGQQASEIVREQDQCQSEARYPTLLLWPFTPKEILNQRLDVRVDQMVNNGLLEEIQTLNRVARALEHTSGKEVDHTDGIFQSIGFKEFQAFLAADDQPQALFDVSVDLMKQATRKYAAYQVKWIRKRLLPAVNAVQTTDPTSVYSYVLDTSDADNWSGIWNSTMIVMDPFINAGRMPSADDVSLLASPLLQVESKAKAPSAVLASRKKRLCEVCTTDPLHPMMFDEEREWTPHCKSRSHQRLVKRKAREPEIALRRAKITGEERSEATLSPRLGPCDPMTRPA